MSTPVNRFILCVCVRRSASADSDARIELLQRMLEVH
jgi:hypothetical protein